MSSLYNLTKDFLEIANKLDELDLDQETIQDTLESLQMPIEEKAENIIKFTRNLEAMAEARKAEAKRLTEQAGKDLKKAESLLNGLDNALRMMGKTKLTAGVFEIKYKKGSEVVLVDETKLPENYFIKEVVKKPMAKPELKLRLKSGVEIPGVSIIRNPDKLTIK